MQKSKKPTKNKESLENCGFKFYFQFKENGNEEN